MQPWLRISLLLCTFGFFRDMRPSEPFIVEFLTGPERNISSEVLNREVFPYGTYSVLIQLVLVFLLTDILRYKPIIVVSAIAAMIQFSFLLYARTVWALDLGQLFYGTFVASEVAYYTYIYANVEKEHYQIVSGHTRSAILCGRFMAAVLSQVLVSTESLSLIGLIYISFGSEAVSFLIALILPSVPQSIYFYKQTNEEQDGKREVDCNTPPPAIENGIAEEQVSNRGSINNKPESKIKSSTSKQPKFSWKNAFRLLWQHTKSAYTNRTVLKWSIWWSLATCGQLQVLLYAQILWKEIDANQENVYNGAVEATVTLLSAAAAMAAGLMEGVRKKHWHMWIITLCSILMGVSQIISAFAEDLWLAYAMYILFGILYYFVITIASAIVAHNLIDESFGLIFGINTLLALVSQTILTLIVLVGLGLSPRDQYIVYGSYFVVMAIIYGIVAVFEQILKSRKSKNFDVIS